MIDDACRNEGLVDLILNEHDKNFIVLSDRVAHLHTLNDLLLFKATQVGLKERSVVISASAKKSDKEARRTAIERMQTGELRVLFATYQLAKEGLDIPRLDGVVFAMPHKDFATIIQSCGRCSRKFAGKEKGTVYDFVDDFGMYKGAFSKRKAHYKRVNYIVNEPIELY
jgi:superfamily II DNA or RNA helicase